LCQQQKSENPKTTQKFDAFEMQISNSTKKEILGFECRSWFHWPHLSFSVWRLKGPREPLAWFDSSAITYQPIARGS